MSLSGRFKTVTVLICEIIEIVSIAVGSICISFFWSAGLLFLSALYADTETENAFWGVLNQEERMALLLEEVNTSHVIFALGLCFAVILCIASSICCIGTGKNRAGIKRLISMISIYFVYNFFLACGYITIDNELPLSISNILQVFIISSVMLMICRFFIKKLDRWNIKIQISKTNHGLLKSRWNDEKLTREVLNDFDEVVRTIQYTEKRYAICKRFYYMLDGKR